MLRRVRNCRFIIIIIIIIICYLYRNILNNTALLCMSHICLRTLDLIANFHIVFIMIIPTLIVFALPYFSSSLIESGTIWFLYMGMV